MEEIFQSLTTKKIQELLVYCGIGDCSDEPIKQHILGISNFVREKRLQVGMTEPPPLPTPRASPNPDAKRGSYRFFPTHDKRGRLDYSGLDTPSPRKKKKSKGKAKDDAILKDLSQEANDVVSSPGDNPGDKTKHSPLSKENTTMNPPRAGTPSTEVSAPRYEEAHQFILENILVNCVKLNDPLGRYGHRSKQANITTKVGEIQSFVDDIVKLQYPDAVQLIKQENALSTSQGIQSRLNETVYWEIIKKGADLLDPKDLPISRGPLDEFTMAEKVATERFMREAGYGLSLANQRQCRLFWKRLFQMRNAGADKILLYRTKEFDRFCKSYSSEAGADLVEMVRLWEEKYGVHIRQLEELVAEESRGDMTGRLWLNQPFVAERLNDPAIEWNSAINRWSSTIEETVFQSSGSYEPSDTPLGGFFDLQPQAATTRNKSIFVTMQPKDDNFLVVCPIIAVQEGDILGVYAGEIRYSADCHYAYGIPGPRENLWLDYSKVTGVLNFMKVSAPGGDSNVRLQWDLIDERKEVNAYLKWRVTAVALREIKPFEELIRVAPQKEQYLLHRSVGGAKRGYTKYRQGS